MLRPPKDRCTQTVYPWADEGVRPYRALPKVSTGTAYLPAGASCHRRILVRGGSPFAPALARSPRRRVFWDSRVRLVLFLMQGISRLTLEMTSCSLGFIMSFRFGYNAKVRFARSKTDFCYKYPVDYVVKSVVLRREKTQTYTFFRYFARISASAETNSSGFSISIPSPTSAASYKTFAYCPSASLSVSKSALSLSKTL